MSAPHSSQPPEASAPTGRESGKPRIVLVDDDPNVLRALRRVLRKKAEAWDVDFYDGAPAALDALDISPADIIVSDISMPKMDGIEMFTKVREKFPDTVRILMSGTADDAVSRRALPVAHQFYAKPLELANLVGVIERALALRSELPTPVLGALIGAVTRLPTPPMIYRELCAVLETSGRPIDDVAHIVAKDAAVSARVLQVVNSAFFTTARRTHEIHGAVRYLGPTAVKNIVLLAELVAVFAEQTLAPGFSVESAQSHAIECANAARIIAPAPLKEAAYTAALLHDIGTLVLASDGRALWEPARSAAKASGEPLWQAEQRVMGTDHARVGAYLLGIWNLPTEIVEAVGAHHKAPVLSGSTLSLTAIVAVANAICTESAPDSFGVDLDTRPELVALIEGWRTRLSRSR